MNPHSSLTPENKGEAMQELKPDDIIAEPILDMAIANPSAITSNNIRRLSREVKFLRNTRAPSTQERESLTLREIRTANIARDKDVFHEIGVWSHTDWATALGGECGELLNKIKKWRRRDGINHKGDVTSLKEIAEECVDTLVYLDVLACSFGIDLEQAYIEKFNLVSANMKSNVTLRSPSPDSPTEEGEVLSEVECHDLKQVLIDRAAEYREFAKITENATAKNMLGIIDSISGLLKSHESLRSSLSEVKRELETCQKNYHKLMNEDLQCQIEPQVIEKTIIANDFGSNEANHLAKELVKVRSAILAQFPTDGSSRFYEKWVMQAVPSPYEVGNMVEAYVAMRERDRMEIKKIEQLLTEFIQHPGSIICSQDATEVEISEAQACDRFLTINSFGFIRRTVKP